MNHKNCIKGKKYLIYEIDNEDPDIVEPDRLRGMFLGHRDGNFYFLMNIDLWSGILYSSKIKQILELSPKDIKEDKAYYVDEFVGNDIVEYKEINGELQSPWGLKVEIKEEIK